MHTEAQAHSPNKGLSRSLVTWRLKQKSGYRKIRFKEWKPSLQDDEASEDIDEVPNLPTKESQRHGVVSRRKRGLSIEKPEYRYYPPSALQRLPVNGTRQDPFIILPIEASDCVPEALDYFLQIAGADNKEGFSVQDADSLHVNPHMSLLLPFLIITPMLFESVIAVCRASILLTRGLPASEDKAFIYHRRRSIEAVNTVLNTSEAGSDATLLTVAMLMTLEYLIGNPSAVNIHLKGLEHILQLRPDLDDGTAWHSFVRAGLEAYKSLGSFVTGSSPVIANDSNAFIDETFVELSLDRPLEYPEPPFDPEICTILSRLSPGFSEICLSGHVSMQMMKILAFVTSTTKYCQSDAIDQQRLDTELQTLLSTLKRFSLMSTVAIEDHVVSGLMAFSFLLRYLRALNLFHDPPLLRLIQTLPNHSKPDSSREQKLMIWISMCSAGALSLRTVRMPGSHLVLDKMFDLYPVTRSWESTKQILKSFLWTEKIGLHWQKCHDYGKRRWDQITRQRREEQSLLLELPPHVLTPQEQDPLVDEEKPTFQEILVHGRSGLADMARAMKAAGCPMYRQFATQNAG